MAPSREEVVFISRNHQETYFQLVVDRAALNLTKSQVTDLKSSGVTAIGVKENDQAKKARITL